MWHQHISSVRLGSEVRARLHDTALLKSTINLTFGRRSRRLHQHPACGGQGLRQMTTILESGMWAKGCFGSSTRISQDGSGPGRLLIHLCVVRLSS